MHILAIDPATKTGWARFKAPSNGKPAELAYGVVEFEKELGSFTRQFRAWLSNQIKGHGITDVFIENPIMPKGQTKMDTLIKLYALNANSHDVVKALGCPLSEVPVGTWRSHFLCGDTPPKEHRGAGKQSKWYKKAVIDRCAERGWQTKDNNEADALGILDWARAQMDPTYAVTSTPLFEGVAS